MAVMDKQKKAVAVLVAGTLANVAVVGFGLAIFENRFSSLLAGVIAIGAAILLTWRAEK
jgi:hypothetical protein